MLAILMFEVLEKVLYIYNLLFRWFKSFAK